MGGYTAYQGSSFFSLPGRREQLQRPSAPRMARRSPHGWVHGESAKLLPLAGVAGKCLSLLLSSNKNPTIPAFGVKYAPENRMQLMLNPDSSVNQF